MFVSHYACCRCVQWTAAPTGVADKRTSTHTVQRGTLELNDTPLQRRPHRITKTRATLRKNTHVAVSSCPHTVSVATSPSAEAEPVAAAAAVELVAVGLTLSADRRRNAMNPPMAATTTTAITIPAMAPLERLRPADSARGYRAHIPHVIIVRRSSIKSDNGQIEPNQILMQCHVPSNRARAHTGRGAGAGAERRRLAGAPAVPGGARPVTGS